jgi:hypothetical protein
MAQPIVTKSTTLEGQLWEVANAMQAAEQLVEGASRPNRITTNIDTEGKTVGVTFSGASITNISDTGALVILPEAYLA